MHVSKDGVAPTPLGVSPTCLLPEVSTKTPPLPTAGSTIATSRIRHADLLVDEDCPRVALHSDSDAWGAYLPFGRTPSPSGILRACALGRAKRLLGGHWSSRRRLTLASFSRGFSLALGAVSESLLARSVLLVVGDVGESFREALLRLRQRVEALVCRRQLLLKCCKRLGLSGAARN